jgi:chromosome condensin MukBEF complex kleisin-like MukF subunit
MKILTHGIAAAGLLALAACGDTDRNTPVEQAADNVEDAAENQSDMFEAQADNAVNEVVEETLENRAKAAEDEGERIADQIEETGDTSLANTTGM